VTTSGRPATDFSNRSANGITAAAAAALLPGNGEPCGAGQPLPLRPTPDLATSSRARHGAVTGRSARQVAPVTCNRLDHTTGAACLADRAAPHTSSRQATRITDQDPPPRRFLNAAFAIRSPDPGRAAVTPATDRVDEKCDPSEALLLRIDPAASRLTDAAAARRLFEAAFATDVRTIDTKGAK
jgi:hypothetical protein